MESHELIRALRQVPETRLQLIDLAWEFLGEDGNLDFKKMAFYSKELEEAIHEARNYIRAIEGILLCLKQITRS